MKTTENLFEEKMKPTFVASSASSRKREPRLEAAIVANLKKLGYYL